MDRAVGLPVTILQNGPQVCAIHFPLLVGIPYSLRSPYLIARNVRVVTHFVTRRVAGTEKEDRR
jgi:hypothetical protein